MDEKTSIERVFAAIEKSDKASEKLLSDASTEVNILSENTKNFNSDEKKTFDIVKEIIKNIAENQTRSAKKKCTNKIKGETNKLIKKYLKRHTERDISGPRYPDEPEPDYDQTHALGIGTDVKTKGQHRKSNNIQDQDTYMTEEYERQRGEKASQAMRHNNPEIADLSDRNRPTKIAERYTLFYDNEWTSAFEILSEKKKTEEKKITQLLLQIVEDAYSFAKKEAEQQILRMNSAIMNILDSGDIKGKTSNKEMSNDVTLLVQFRKQHAERSIKRLQENFENEVKKRCSAVVGAKPSKSGVMMKYGREAVELTWWMCVQDPPVYMVISEASKGDKFNPDFYKAYTKSGKTPDFFVWPPLKLHESGGILAKGVVQYK